MRSFSAWKRVEHLGGRKPSQCYALLTEFSPKTRSLYSRRFYLCKSIFASFLACFLLSKILSLLSRRVFALQKCFCRFPGAFSAFKSSFVAFSAQFQLSKVLLLVSLRVFVLQNYFCAFLGAISTFKSTFSFGQNKKSSYSEEFLWQRL